MKEIPILYSTPMAIAKRDHRKTVTRRTRGLEILNERPDDYRFVTSSDVNENVPRMAVKYDDRVYYLLHLTWTNELDFVFKAPWKKGDWLWGRETFFIEKYFNGLTEECIPLFKTEYMSGPVGWNWMPSIHMPKEIARFWDEVVDVRLERLHDITEADAIAEGVEHWFDDASFGEVYVNYLGGNIRLNAIDSYRTLWESINGPGSWALNPWIWRIESKQLSTTGRP